MFQIAKKQTFEDGQIIWEEGSSGDWICVIESGKVELSKMLRGEKVAVSVLQPAEIVGEIGYITRGTRAFTARAVGPTILGIVDPDFLEQEYNGMSDSFKTILKSLSLRLQEVSESTNFCRRFPREIQALSLAFKNRGTLIKAFTANASGGGLLIKTPKPLSKGEQFSIKLHLPGNPEPVRIESEVVWSRTESDDPVKYPVGMGVKFIGISSTDQQRLVDELKLTDSGINSE